MRYVVYWNFSRSFHRSMLRKYLRGPMDIKRGSIVNALSPAHAEKKWRANAPEHRVFVSVKEENGYKPPSKREMKMIHQHIWRLKA